MLLRLFISALYTNYAIKFVQLCLAFTAEQCMEFVCDVPANSQNIPTDKLLGIIDLRWGFGGFTKPELKLWRGLRD